jgi:TfoX/Sxy family transcriptional regulator of competence genes
VAQGASLQPWACHPTVVARLARTLGLAIHPVLTMASDLNTVAFIADQSGLGTRLASRRMFGEYALYLNGKVIAFICDNKLYLKPTDAGRALLGTPIEAPAYPGSKNYFLLEEELENPELLRRALEVTESVLPLPKPKSPSQKRQTRVGVRAKPQ